MSSADPERQGDAALPVRFGPAEHRTARRDLAAELAQHLPSRSERETMLAALREVWALAERWKAGISDVGPAAAAELMDTIRGECQPWREPPWLPGQAAADQCGAGLLYEPDAPFRSGGVRPGE